MKANDTQGRVDRYILTQRGQLLNRGYILAGSNDVQYDRIRFG